MKYRIKGRYLTRDRAIHINFKLIESTFSYMCKKLGTHSNEKCHVMAEGASALHEGLNCLLTDQYIGNYEWKLIHL